MTKAKHIHSEGVIFLACHPQNCLLKRASTSPNTFTACLFVINFLQKFELYILVHFYCVNEKRLVTLKLIQLELNLRKSNVPRQVEVSALFALMERLVRAAVRLYDTLALNRLVEVVCWDERGGVSNSTWAPPS
jgi:hypothetical protein